MFIKMSMSSYRRNRRTGLTSKWTPTCFPAALEQISPKHSLSPASYVGYLEFLETIESLKGQEKRRRNPLFKALLVELAEELGSSYDEIIFERYNTARAFRTGVRGLLRNSCRVAVDIITEGCEERRNGFVHSVGLLPIPGYGYDTDYVRLISNWVPLELQGPVDLDELYPHVAHIPEPYRVRFPFNDCNVVAIPQ